MTSIIVAMTLDGAIGKDGDQLYYITGDLRRFKSLTVGNTVIMGRKTFEALPKGALPGRKNIVVTRNNDYRPEGASTVSSIESAIDNSEGEAFIIGGAQIYGQAICLSDRLILTEINVLRPDADAFFPPFDTAEWTEEDATPWQEDPRTGIEYRYRTLLRKSPRVAQGDK